MSTENNIKKASKPTLVVQLSSKIESYIIPLVKKMEEKGMTANQLTFAQLPFAILMFFVLINKLWILSAIFLFITLFFDVADGMFARITKTTTEKGHLYDKIMDLIGIYLFLIGIFIAISSLWLMVLIIGVSNAILYGIGFYYRPELVSGVRSIGLFWLIFWRMEIFLWIILILCIAEIIYMIVRGERKC